MNDCGGEVCLTCSDELRPVRVVALVEGDSGLARVDDAGVERLVAVDLVDGVRCGDVLLVHGGVALQRSLEPVSGSETSEEGRQ